MDAIAAASFRAAAAATESETPSPIAASSARHATRRVATRGIQSGMPSNAFDGSSTRSASAAAFSLVSAESSNAAARARDASAARSARSSSRVSRRVILDESYSDPSAWRTMRSSRVAVFDVASASLSASLSASAPASARVSAPLPAAARASAASRSHPNAALETAYTSTWSTRAAAEGEVASPNVTTSSRPAATVSASVRGTSYHRRAPVSNATRRRASTPPEGPASDGSVPAAARLSPRRSKAAGGLGPMRRSRGTRAAEPSPTCTRRPRITWSGLMSVSTRSCAPGPGASTPPLLASAASAKRTDSDDRPRAKSPPKRVWAVTHSTCSKKSSGKAGCSSTSARVPAGRSRLSGPSAPPAIFAAAAARPAARSAARASCARCASAAATPGGGAGSRANTRSDPSSISAKRNATSMSVGWNPQWPSGFGNSKPPRAEPPEAGTSGGDSPPASGCAAKASSARDTKTAEPPRRAETATNWGRGGVVGPAGAPARGGAGGAHASFQRENPDGATEDSFFSSEDSSGSAPSRSTHAHVVFAEFFAESKLKSSLNAADAPPSKAANATPCASE